MKASTRRLPRSRWVWIWSCAAACSAPAIEDDSRSARINVAVFGVELQDHYTVTRRFSGTARSRRASALGFERSGKVRRLFVEEGDRVAAGQLIAELDRSVLLAARRRTEASLREAVAAVELAELTASRLGNLADKEFTSTQSRDEAQFSLARAEAQRDALEAALYGIDVDLGKTRLKAPFAGVVASRLVDEGTVVASGQSVVRFLEEEFKEATIGVPPTVMATIESDTDVRIAVRGKRANAEVIGKINDVDAVTRTASIIVRIPQELSVADGERVSLELDERIDAAGYWVPVTALTKGLRGLRTVYAIEPGSEGASETLRREEVQVIYTETTRAFVRGTLENGDRVVASGIHRVVPGQEVSVEPSVATIEEVDQ